MSIIKNTAGQYLYAVLVSAVDGSAITTGASLSLAKDGAASGAAGATLTHRTGGLWEAALTQTDTNGNSIGYVWGGTNVIPQGGCIITVDHPRSAIPAATAGASNGLLIAGNNAATVFATLTSTGAFTVSGSVNLLADVRAYGTGMAPLQPTTAGRTLDVDTTHKAPATLQSTDVAGQLPANMVKMFGEDVNVPVGGVTFSSTVSNYAGADTTGITTLLARLSATRAGLLDNLDAPISGLNNLSALINIYGSPLLEIPDSGTSQFAYTVVVRDSEGKLVDLDASPTVAAANAAGTSRSTNLSSVSHPATGRYTFTYGVTSAAAEESLRITVSGAVSSEARYIEWIGAVVNYDTITTLAAIKAKTDNLPGDPASNTTLGSVQEALEDDISQISAVLPSFTPGTAGGLLIAGANAATTFNVLTVTNTATFGSFTVTNNFVVNGVKNMGDAATFGTRGLAMLQQVGTSGVYQYTAQSIALAPTGGGSSGPTAFEIAVAVVDQTLEGHTTAGTVGKALVDAQASGNPLESQVPGTYADGTAGAALGRLNNTPPDAPVIIIPNASPIANNCAVFGYAFDLEGNLMVGVTIAFDIIPCEGPLKTAAGGFYGTRQVKVQTTDATMGHPELKGLFVAYLPRGGVFRISSTTDGFRMDGLQFTVPNATEFNLDGIDGVTVVV